MKKGLLTLILALAASLSANCADYWTAVDGINYILNYETHTAKVYWHQYAEYEGDVVIPSVVRYLFPYFDSDTADYTVTSIYWNAFWNESDVTSITLPETIDSIGDRAFNSCGITSITLPKNVKKIGVSVFEGCRNLKSATFLMDSLPDLPYYTFSECTSLESIQLPKYCPSIGEQAFYKCPLTSIDLPEGVLSIQAGAFRQSSLSSIQLPNSLQTIGQYAFRECPLQSIEWPESLTTIGNSAFASCHFRGEFILPKNVQNWGTSVFAYNTAIESVVVPDGLTSIGDYAFSGCFRILYIHFGNTLKTIGEGSFENIKQQYKVLKSITIPHNVESIASRAFRWADPQAIYIGSGVQSIGSSAFDGAAPSVIFNYATTPQQIDSSVFYFGKENCVLSVPVGCKAAYEAADVWNEFTIVDTITSMEMPYDYGYDHVLIDSLYYNLDAVRHTAEVTYKSKGDAYSHNNYNVDWDIATAHIPESVTYKGETYPVTSISVAAFADCANLRSVMVPATITTIPEYAFYQCGQLSSVVLPATLTAIGANAFRGSLLTELTLPQALTSIGSYAFYETALTRMDIPSSVTSFGVGVFYGCAQLERVTLPEGITTIGSSMFSFCAKLDSVIIPSTVTSIGYYAFAWAPSLTTITIPNSVDSIGERAFYDCSGLQEIRIPHALRTIGKQAFENCTNLHKIEWHPSDFSLFTASNFPIDRISHLTVGQEVTSIADNAFSSCSQLTNIVWNAAHYTANASRVFNGIKPQITSFVFGEDVESIPEYLCYQMKNIPSVTIPEKVSFIGKSAFYECNNLTKIHISNLAAYCNITFDGDPYWYLYADLYLNDEKVTELVIPEGITTLHSNAFQFKSISTVTLPASLQVAETNPFYDAREIHVPSVDFWLNLEKQGYLASYRNGANLYVNNEIVRTIIIPEEMTKLTDYEFTNLTCLQFISIHRQVDSIGERTFYKCKGLDSIYNYATTPQQVSEYTTGGINQGNSKTKLHVPKGTIEAYRAAGWKFYVYEGDQARYSTIIDDLLNPAYLEQAIAEATAYHDALVADYNDIKEPLLEAIQLAQAKADTISTNESVNAAVQTLNEALEAAKQAVAARLAALKTDFEEYKEIQADSIEYRRGLFYSYSYYYQYEEYPSQVKAIPYDSLLLYVTNTERVDTMVARMHVEFDGAMEQMIEDFKQACDYTYECESLRTKYTDVPEADSLITAAVLAIQNYQYIETISNEANCEKKRDIYYQLEEDLAAARAAKRYTITFVNWDKSPLLVLDKVREGTVPVYTGETPTRAEDAEFTYTFISWTPEIVAAVEDATYTATYEATPKPEGIEDIFESSNPQIFKSIIDGQLLIFRGDKSYTIDGREVK